MNLCGNVNEGIKYNDNIYTIIYKYCIYLHITIYIYKLYICIFDDLIIKFNFCTKTIKKYIIINY